MNQIRFQQVWFADENKNRSVTKLVVLTDRGSLEVAPDSLQFWGRKLRLHISHIKDVSLARQQINWVTYLIMNVVLVIYFALMVKTFPNVYSFPFLLFVLLGANIFGISMGYSTRWVKVEYSDDKNQSNKVFFADGSSFGWGGIFGGTEKMYQALKRSIGRDSSATYHSTVRAHLTNGHGDLAARRSR